MVVRPRTTLHSEITFGASSEARQVNHDFTDILELTAVPGHIIGRWLFFVCWGYCRIAAFIGVYAITDMAVRYIPA